MKFRINSYKNGSSSRIKADECTKSFRGTPLGCVNMALISERRSLSSVWCAKIILCRFSRWMEWDKDLEEPEEKATFRQTGCNKDVSHGAKVLNQSWFSKSAQGRLVEGLTFP